LEEAMDAVERMITSLKKASRHWNIPLTSMFNHLYGKTKSKKTRPTSVPIVKEDQRWFFGFKLCRMLGCQ
jgi:hypothetical protein